MPTSILVALLAPPLLAQSSLPTANPRLAALDIIKADNAWTLQQQVELTQIPSPPFKESARAAEDKKRLVSRAAGAKLSLVVDTMGIRPTGGQSDAAPIVQIAINAAKALGFTSSTSASSTDSNPPISLGIPAALAGAR